MAWVCTIVGIIVSCTKYRIGGLGYTVHDLDCDPPRQQKARQGSECIHLHFTHLVLLDRWSVHHGTGTDTDVVVLREHPSVEVGGDIVTDVHLRHVLTNRDGKKSTINVSTSWNKKNRQLIAAVISRTGMEDGVGTYTYVQIAGVRRAGVRHVEEAFSSGGLIFKSGIDFQVPIHTTPTKHETREEKRYRCITAYTRKTSTGSRT